MVEVLWVDFVHDAKYSDGVFAVVYAGSTFAWRKFGTVRLSSFLRYALDDSLLRVVLSDTLVRSALI